MDNSYFIIISYDKSLQEALEDFSKGKEMTKEINISGNTNLFEIKKITDLYVELCFNQAIDKKYGLPTYINVFIFQNNKLIYAYLVFQENKEISFKTYTIKELEELSNQMDILSHINLINKNNKK